MARGNQREKAREKNLKAQSAQVSLPALLTPFLFTYTLLPQHPRSLVVEILETNRNKSIERNMLIDFV